MLRQVISRLRNASRKITKRTVARTAFRRSLFVESLEDRRLLASIAYTSGHSLNAADLAAVGLTVTPGVGGYSSNDAGFASALASGADALLIGEERGFVGDLIGHLAAQHRHFGVYGPQVLCDQDADGAVAATTVGKLKITTLDGANQQGL